jgi:hypothetical protein
LTTTAESRSFLAFLGLTKKLFLGFSESGHRCQSLAEELSPVEPPEKRKQFVASLEEARSSAQKDAAMLEIAEHSRTAEHDKTLKKITKILAEPIPASGPQLPPQLKRLVEKIIRVRSPRRTGRFSQIDICDCTATGRKVTLTKENASAMLFCPSESGSLNTSVPFKIRA